MKKRKNIGIIALAIVFSVGIVSFALQGDEFAIQQGDGFETKPGNESATKQGTDLGLSIKKNVEIALAKSNGNSMLNDESRIAGVVLGEEIDSNFVQIRAKTHMWAGEENPLEAAWSGIKVQIYEKQFAAEHNLTPSAQEILEFTQKMREDAEYSAEGRTYTEAIISGMGLTPDEYWNDYKIKYESPAHLTKIKVGEYFEEYDLPPIDPDDIEGEITDTLLLEEFENRLQTRIKNLSAVFYGYKRECRKQNRPLWKLCVIL